MQIRLTDIYYSQYLREMCSKYFARILRILHEAARIPSIAFFLRTTSKFHFNANEKQIYCYLSYMHDMLAVPVERKWFLSVWVLPYEYYFISNVNLGLEGEGLLDEKRVVNLSGGGNEGLDMINDSVYVYLETGDNTEAVRRGLQQTGRLITVAASVMVIVFASFTIASVQIIKAIGLGLALAIAIDSMSEKNWASAISSA